MYSFQYQRPPSTASAISLIKQDQDAKYLAGGMTLLPAMKHRLAQPSQLIDIGQISDLNFIRQSDGYLCIGATTQHAQVASSALVQQLIPGLAKLAQLIGDPQVRARGTLGGSLANNDPAADYPAAVLALNGQMITNQRTIAAADFFQGLYTTCLNDGELIGEIRLQIPQQSTYVKLKQAASGYALVGVFVASYGPSEIQIAVTGVGNGVFRWDDAEKALQQQQAIPALVHEDVIEDIHASAKYRAHMTRVLLEQALVLLPHSV